MANLCGQSPKTFRGYIGGGWIDESYGTEMWNKINDQLNKVDKPLTLIISNTGVFFVCSSEFREDPLLERPLGQAPNFADDL